MHLFLLRFYKKKNIIHKQIQQAIIIYPKLGWHMNFYGTVKSAYKSSTESDKNYFGKCLNL